MRQFQSKNNSFNFEGEISFNFEGEISFNFEGEISFNFEGEITFNFEGELLVTCSPCSSLCYFGVEAFFQRTRSKVGALQRCQYTVTSTPWLQLQLLEDSAKEDIQSQNPSIFFVTRTVVVVDPSLIALVKSCSLVPL